jgi:hypothetical protein
MKSYNPPQWGCTWDGGDQIKKLGLAYYWNDKESIEIIETNKIDDIIIIGEHTALRLRPCEETQPTIA